MAILPITITGTSVLHVPALPVTAFDDDLRTLVADMRETMLEAPGVGLAAPQVGVDQQIFIYSWEDEAGELHEGTAINPTLWLSPASITPLDLREEVEGCLSVPGERFPLRRADRAVLEGVDEFGEPFRVEARGWLARIFQHEFDHLLGILYVDRLVEPHATAARRVIKKRGWGKRAATWVPGVDDLEG